MSTAGQTIARKPRGRDGAADMEIMCWCQSTVMKVTRENVYNGVTESCGRNGCSSRIKR